MVWSLFAPKFVSKHKDMMRRTAATRSSTTVGLLGLSLAISAGFAGCNGTTSTKQVKARPPAPTPVAQAPKPDFVREPLPFTRELPNYSALQPAVRPSIDILVEKVEAAYNTGQKYLKAGDPEIRAPAGTSCPTPLCA